MTPSGRTSKATKSNGQKFLEKADRVLKRINERVLIPLERRLHLPGELELETKKKGRN